MGGVWGHRWRSASKKRRGSQRDIHRSLEHRFTEGSRRVLCFAGRDRDHRQTRDHTCIGRSSEHEQADGCGKSLRQAGGTDGMASRKPLMLSMLNHEAARGSSTVQLIQNAGVARSD